MNRPPIALSYRPKEQDYLPVVVAAIRRHLGDWPIVLLTENHDLPPTDWLERNEVATITDWQHSPRANKVLRLWEHQEIFAEHFDAWIWWHDDMLLLKHLPDPAETFNRPLVVHRQRKRPNRELGNWQGWLWETLAFFRCQSIYAPNPVLHTPRLIERGHLGSIPANWNRKRLLFEPTYLLWKWHRQQVEPEVARDFRKCQFSGAILPVQGSDGQNQPVLVNSNADCPLHPLQPQKEIGHLGCQIRAAHRAKEARDHIAVDPGRVQRGIESVEIVDRHLRPLNLNQGLNIHQGLKVHVGCHICWARAAHQSQRVGLDAIEQDSSKRC